MNGFVIASLIVLALIVAFAAYVIGYFRGYESGLDRERHRHYIWMGDGWDKCSEHFDELEHNSDWAYAQLRYMTKVFGTERPYPMEEKVEK